MIAKGESSSDDAVTFRRDEFPRFANAEEWMASLGNVPLHRIWFNPWPGTATVDDVVAIDAHHDRLCELVDGTLVEKPVGFDEDQIGTNIIMLLGAFVKANKLGFLAGAQGMVRLLPDQVRVPDVAFYDKSIAYDRDDPVPAIAPTLAIEVLSKSNTKGEMDRKLREYFQAGTSVVWYVDPPTKSVTVYTAVDQSTTLGEGDTIDGGAVLPGFEAKVCEFFA